MATEVAKCLLCKNDCTRRPAGDHGYDYGCKACKEYGVGDMFEHIATENELAARHILAGYSRYRFENGDQRPVFRYHTDIFDAIQRNEKGDDPYPEYSIFAPKNVDEQLFRILGFLLKNRTELGQWKELVPDHEFTICFARSANEFRELLKRAAARGWIERRSNMHSDQVSLTEDGEAALARWSQSESENRMSDSNEPWVDVMQVCEKGHLITEFVKSQPNSTKKRCPKCGSQTITECPSCGTEIEGYHHIPGVFGGFAEEPPACCDECGEPYPWTATTSTHSSTTTSATGEPVFVIHGHDESMKQHVARVVQQLGLRPIILHDQPNCGKTIIEKFEKNADVRFAVALLAPDDLAYAARRGNPREPKPRARQNVILELGYFVGKLGRERVFALKRGDDLEIPSDFSGVAYTPYDDSASWRLELVRELQAAGYQVDANHLLP